jgi:hypothetical protein
MATRRTFFRTLFGGGGAVAVATALTALEPLAPKAAAIAVDKHHRYIFRIPGRVPWQELARMEDELRDRGLDVVAVLDGGVEIFELQG